MSEKRTEVSQEPSVPKKSLDDEFNTDTIQSPETEMTAEYISECYTRYSQETVDIVRDLGIVVPEKFSPRVMVKDDYYAHYVEGSTSAQTEQGGHIQLTQNPDGTWHNEVIISILPVNPELMKRAYTSRLAHEIAHTFIYDHTQIGEDLLPERINVEQEKSKHEERQREIIQNFKKINEEMNLNSLKTDFDNISIIMQFQIVTETVVSTFEIIENLREIMMNLFSPDATEIDKSDGLKKLKQQRDFVDEYQKKRIPHLQQRIAQKKAELKNYSKGDLDYLNNLG